MRKVLVVGMLDSVHLARWLSQFSNQTLEITVFPSSRFRRIHPDLKTMIKSNQINFYSSFLEKILSFVGYLDFIRFELFISKFRIKSRSQQLRRCLTQSNFDILHLIELQHAGYLYLETGLGEERSFKVITTNYGSDIFFFKSLPDHRSKLERLLKQSDFYSAECRRDYFLAREIGFEGVELPLVPNAGGFNEIILSHRISPLRERRTVYIKGHGGEFGLGEMSLRVADRLLHEFSHIEVVVVSLSDELRGLARQIQKRHKKRIRVYRSRNAINREQVLGILRRSLVYIGASKSDGISTTFLEAIVSGAVPIQTNTSCANEWIEKGFYAMLVPPSENWIFDSARTIVERAEEYESLVIRNNSIAKQLLSDKIISSIARTFYN
jgi:glycosyltransferase involved in cell wall biosynthesis